MKRINMNKKAIIIILLALFALAGQGQTNKHFFHTDSAVIIGKIVGLEAEAMPKQVFVEWNNALTNIPKDNIVDIATDGSFTCRMQLQAIEESRDLRRQLQDNPDLRLIFIAQENAPRPTKLLLARQP